MSYEIAEQQEQVQVSPALQIEKNLIAMFCANKSHMTTCMGVGLRPHHFCGIFTKKIFEACVKLDEQVSSFDMLVLADEVTRMAKRDHSEQVREVILNGNMLKADLLPVHAKTIIARAAKAQMVSAVNKLMEDALSPAFSVNDQLPAFIEQMTELLAGNAQGRGLRTIQEVLADQVELMRLREAGLEKTISTGIKSLDGMIGGGGFRPGKLVALAGRPAMGKSVMAQHFAMQCSMQGGNVFIFSLEMPCTELGDRIIAATGRVSLYDIQNPPKEDEPFWDRYSAAVKLAEKELTGMYIDDTPRMTVHSIIREAKRMSAKVKPSMIVIDYLTLIETDNDNDNETELQRVTKITRYLKNQAKEMDCTIILLCQFNRQAEAMGDKRPTAAQLRSSGSIEQDSDIVLGLHRPVVYDQDFSDPELCEVLVLKVRNGTMGTAYTSFHGGTQSFMDRGNWLPEAIENKPSKYSRNVK